MITFPTASFDAVVDHAIDCAPGECCGILTGSRDGSQAHVEAVHRTANVADEPRTTYEVDPAQQLEIMTACEDRGRDVVGFYHSHPAGPGRPSPTDRARATWVDHTYVIVSLEAGHPFVGAWFLTDEGFEPEVVSLETA